MLASSLQKSQSLLDNIARRAVIARELFLVMFHVVAEP